MLQWFPTAALVAVMLIAALTDVRTRRIPNNLVIAGLTLGLATRALTGWGALGEGVLAAALALALGIVLFSAGAMGAGDGKLMAVVGSFMGLEMGLYALGAAAVVGGILSMLLAIRRGVILPILFSTRDLAAWLFTFGRRGERVKLGGEGAVAFPFGVAIAIGALATWFGALPL